MCVITQKGDGGLLSGWAVQQWAKFNSTQSRGRDRRPLFCRPSPRARSSDSHWTRRPTADGGTGAGAGVRDERWVCCDPSWRPCRPQTAHWRGAGSSQGPPPPASDWVRDMGGGGAWLDSAAKKDSMQKESATLLVCNNTFILYFFKAFNRKINTFEWFKLNICS